MNLFDSLILSCVGMVLYHGLKTCLAGYRWRPLGVVRQRVGDRWVPVLVVPDEVPLLYRLYPSRRFALQA